MDELKDRRMGYEAMLQELKDYRASRVTFALGALSFLLLVLLIMWSSS